MKPMKSARNRCVSVPKLYFSSYIRQVFNTFKHSHYNYRCIRCITVFHMHFIYWKNVEKCFTDREISDRDGQSIS